METHPDRRATSASRAALPRRTAADLERRRALADAADTDVPALAAVLQCGIPAQRRRSRCLTASVADAPEPPTAQPNREGEAR